MKKIKKNNIGFTIIELLIVVAIIGVLAAIVLINVTGYINKGKDAAAKGDLSTLFTNAITYYNENSDFDGVESDPDYLNAKNALTGEKMGYTTIKVECDKSPTCADGGSTKWCASISLQAVPDTTYYCIDSSGAKRESATAQCNAGVCLN